MLICAVLSLLLRLFESFFFLCFVRYSVNENLISTSRTESLNYLSLHNKCLDNLPFISPLVFVYFSLFLFEWGMRWGGAEMTFSIRKIYGCYLTQKCWESYSSVAANIPLTGLGSSVSWNRSVWSTIYQAALKIFRNPAWVVDMYYALKLSLAHA